MIFFPCPPRKKNEMAFINAATSMSLSDGTAAEEILDQWEDTLSILMYIYDNITRDKSKRINWLELSNMMLLSVNSLLGATAVTNTQIVSDSTLMYFNFSLTLTSTIILGGMRIFGMQKELGDLTAYTQDLNSLLTVLLVRQARPLTHRENPEEFIQKHITQYEEILSHAPSVNFKTYRKYQHAYYHDKAYVSRNKLNDFGRKRHLVVMTQKAEEPSSLTPSSTKLERWNIFSSFHKSSTQLPEEDLEMKTLKELVQ